MDDREYIDAIKEANKIGSRNQLRRLFVTMLFMNTMTKSDVVWTATWKLLVDEIVYQKRRQLNISSKIYVIFSFIYLKSINCLCGVLM